RLALQLTVRRPRRRGEPEVVDRLHAGSEVVAGNELREILAGDGRRTGGENAGGGLLGGDQVLHSLEGEVEMEINRVPLAAVVAHLRPDRVEGFRSGRGIGGRAG